MAKTRIFLLAIAALILTMLALGSTGTQAKGDMNLQATAAATDSVTASGTASAAAKPTDEPTTVATEAPINGEKPVLNVYNWTTYIAEDTVANFEKLYNVKVVYDTYESND